MRSCTRGGAERDDDERCRRGRADALSEDVDEPELLRVVAAAERSSEHPLAQAIVAGVEDRGLAPPQASEFDSATGRGVRATVDGRHLLIGTRRLLGEEGIDSAPLEAPAQRLETEGKTAILVALDGEPAGVIAATATREGCLARSGSVSGWASSSRRTLVEPDHQLLAGIEAAQVALLGRPIVLPSLSLGALPMKHLLGFVMEAFESFHQVVDRHGQLEALAALILAPADVLQQLEVFAELQAEPCHGGELLVPLQRVEEVAYGAKVVADQLVPKTEAI
jgi:hypothetical protein